DGAQDERDDDCRADQRALRGGLVGLDGRGRLDGAGRKAVAAAALAHARRHTTLAGRTNPRNTRVRLFGHYWAYGWGITIVRCTTPSCQPWRSIKAPLIPAFSIRR